MTTPTQEDERVRSYLIAQANKLSIPDLVEKVRRDVLPLRDAVGDVPSAHFLDRPAPDDWSAAEVLTHILDMNDRGAAAITGILDNGTLPPPISDQMSRQVRDGLHGPNDFWPLYQPRREQLLERAIRANGDEHLDVKITHNQFGALSWREWLLFMRVHDLDHLRQLQAVTRHFAG